MKGRGRPVAVACGAAVLVAGLWHPFRADETGARGATGARGGAEVSDICALKGSETIASRVLRGRIRLGRHPEVQIPLDPRWDEDPVADPNWEFDYHSLRWLDPLWSAWVSTRSRGYRDRYEFLLRDWVEDNSRDAPPSSYSWNDHSTAWRAVGFACALRRLGSQKWLMDAATQHGRLLASEAFYVRHGNHALNQSSGLLALGCTLRINRWIVLAARRIEVLGRESVDEQGVINEQALGYQYYNYRRYSSVMGQMKACGVLVSRELRRRVDLMPRFLAFAALPNGRLEMLGDTLDDPVIPIRGTAVEFVATQGRRGPRPPARYAVYNAGYAFMRSEWGAQQPLADETAIAVRFGPGLRFHGHRDAGAVTLYARGDRILLDPGMYHFKRDLWRAWMRSGRAHNTIAVDGSYMHDDHDAALVGSEHGPTFDWVAIRHRKTPGVTHERRVFYNRRLDVIVVDDDLRADAPRTFRQWWHLHPEADPVLRADGFFTGRRGHTANAWVVQLGDRKPQKTLHASMTPIQGWVSFGYGLLERAPVVNVRAAGRHVRYITLIVPAPTAERIWTVNAFRLTRDGYVLDISARGRRALIVQGDGVASEVPR